MKLAENGDLNIGELLSASNYTSETLEPLRKFPEQKWWRISRGS